MSKFFYRKRINKRLLNKNSKGGKRFLEWIVLTFCSLLKIFFSLLPFVSFAVKTKNIKHKNHK